MIEPTVKSFPYCPFANCKGEPILIKKKVKQPSFFTGKYYWAYECPICKESFTTTESDTLSLKYKQ